MNLVALWVTVAFLAIPNTLHAFCGFYVAKADSKLYNKASQVAIVRHEEKTVISMLNDYEGELSEFALVVPVPEVLKEGQIHVGDSALFQHLDAFTAPRLVEYFDPDPCQEYMVLEDRMLSKMGAGAPAQKARNEGLGVKVEAQYTVGEYDIVILSATDSSGLEKWLTTNGYRIPKGASRALKPYIRQDMKFFVAKVNLKEQAKTGLTFLRPLQFAFESKRFMLPIRLGMINANGPQDLLIYVLTKNGRVETTNYRTVKLPTGTEIPPYVKDDFGLFYKAMFSEHVKKENHRAVFTEYFWNMSWCDPCAADPLSADELRQLGVFWLNAQPSSPSGKRRLWNVPGRPSFVPPSQPQQVMVTRLHVRYSNDTFPEDLMFQETEDAENYQARYVLRHPWTGSKSQCKRAAQYFEELPKRQDQEAQNLARLTGWEISEIRKKLRLEMKPAPWWQNLWK